jgi:8-oxo-dGTP pyrophosphatase MutT (NUDIX family)
MTPMARGESKWVLGIYRRMPRWLSALAVRLLMPKHVIGVVSVVINEERQVLVLKHTYGRPEWRLPGGLLEHGEEPQHTAVRELEEEACCIGRAHGVIDAVQSPYTFDIAVRIMLVEERPFQPSPEISERKWIGEDQLGILPETQRRFVREALKRGLS